MTQSLQIEAEQFFDGKTSGGPAVVVVRDGKVAEARLSPQAASPPKDALTPGRFMTPGLVDIQVNGAMGFSFLTCDEDGVRRVAAELARRGTTSFLATLVTAPRDVMLKGVERLAALVGVVPGLEGIHIEGPFLNPERRGAHRPDQIRPPDWDEAAEWLRAGGAALRLVTLAPEMDGALELVERLAAAGVTVSAGHTDASYELMVEAVKRGLRLVTHAGNVADWPKRLRLDPNRPLHSEPSIVGSVLALEELSCSLIADGVHTHPALARALLRAKPGQVAVVSDLTALAGLGPGLHEIAGLRARITEDGIAVRPEGDLLAGSVRFQSQDLAVCVNQGAVDPPMALEAMTSTPARLVGLYPRKGALRPGADADVLVWNDALGLEEVYQGGRRINPKGPMDPPQHAK